MDSQNLRLDGPSVLFNKHLCMVRNLFNVFVILTNVIYMFSSYSC